MTAPSRSRLSCSRSAQSQHSTGGLLTFAALANRIRGIGVKQTLEFATVLLDHIHFTPELLAHEYDAIRHFPGD